MGDVRVGNPVVIAALEHAAQGGDGTGRPVQFLLALRALHGQETAPHLHKGQAHLAQKPQVRHRPGGGKVKLLPEVGGLPRLLGPGVEGGDPLQLQLLRHRLQPGKPLLQPVQQGEGQGRAEGFQHHAGEARPGAHVNELGMLQPPTV